MCVTSVAVSPSALFALLVSGLLAIAAWSRLSELHRASSLARAAVALGLRFEAHAGRFIARGPSGLALFRVSGGVGRNLVTDGRVTLFDYLARGGPDARSPEGSLMVVGAAEARGLVAFRLEFKRPGAFGLGSAVYAAADEIELPAPAAFAEQYRLFGDDPAAVAARFTPAVMRFFAANPGWSVESNGAWLIAHDGAGHLEPARLAAQLAAVRQVVALFA